MSETVALCWAHPGDVSGRFMDSVLRIFQESGRAAQAGEPDTPAIMGYHFVEGGPRIAHARNELVRTFLASERYANTEWLLMLDADMTFDGSLLKTLFHDVRSAQGKVQRPIVGGLYFGGGHGAIFPLTFQLVDPETNDNNPISIITDWTPGEMLEVDATGTGCLLIHRGVLEHFSKVYEEPTPWFAESVHNGFDFGEDWTFCMRARMQGLPIYVNTAVQLGHMKAVCLTEQTWRTGQTGLTTTSAPPPKIQLSRQQRRREARGKAA